MTHMHGMFSTKGRYALRVMADLATHDGWVSLGDVSKRQGISRKYLEQVTAVLVKVISSRASAAKAAAISSTAIRTTTP